MNWTQILQAASIKDPPGYRETVEVCLKRKADGLPYKRTAKKK